MEIFIMYDVNFSYVKGVKSVCVCVCIQQDAKSPTSIHDTASDICICNSTVGFKCFTMSRNYKYLLQMLF